MKLTTGSSSKRWALLRQMILRRADGIAYLDRLRVIQTPWFAVYLHRFDAPDPGRDLHDHPWPFVTMVISGGYWEQRSDGRRSPGVFGGQHLEHRRRFMPRIMRLTECHTIVALDKVGTRSIVLAGRRSRKWGFYTPDGWVQHEAYEGLDRREMTYQENA